MQANKPITQHLKTQHEWTGCFALCSPAPFRTHPVLVCLSPDVGKANTHTQTHTHTSKHVHTHAHAYKHACTHRHVHVHQHQLTASLSVWVGDNECKGQGLAREGGGGGGGGGGVEGLICILHSIGSLRTPPLLHPLRVSS